MLLKTADSSARHASLLFASHFMPVIVQVLWLKSRNSVRCANAITTNVCNGVPTTGVHGVFSPCRCGFVAAPGPPAASNL